ncbi:MAG: FAD:protein FMN transferase, partial [Planctomycetaceae bacterium]|nr:FAD:protein FMN transferase [Planctomycetaceae bacterium]
VSRFNVSESTDWFVVSKETAEVVQIALEISEMTDGAFDITVGRLVDLWGFGANPTSLTIKELEEKTAQIKPKIGYKQLEVRINPPALKKQIPELQIDLSAIAKGYAVDCVAALLEKHGFVHYLIEVGGEVRCRGNKGVSGDWIVGIEKPLFTSSDNSPNHFPGLQRKLRLGDWALATSGDYQNFRELDGVKYSHFIDPRTGLPTKPAVSAPEPVSPEPVSPEPSTSESAPLESATSKPLIPEPALTEPALPEPTTSESVTPKLTEQLGSVSVLAETCVRADALATALFVLGEQKGLELAEQHKIAALFLLRTKQKDRPIRESASSAFNQLSVVSSQ